VAGSPTQQRLISSITPKSSSIWADLIASILMVGMGPDGIGAGLPGVAVMAGAACTDGTAGITRAITHVFIAGISAITDATLVVTSATSEGGIVAMLDANSVQTDATCDVTSDRTDNSCGNRGKAVRNASSTGWAVSSAVPLAQDHVTVEATFRAVVAAGAAIIPRP
jgi:hypothetical protein